MKYSNYVCVYIVYYYSIYIQYNVYVYKNGNIVFVYLLVQRGDRSYMQMFVLKYFVKQITMYMYVYC